ncbi:MAG: DUF2279 domain-containing protein, partial [Flavobacteriaceae bacterium]|nr:YfiM family protein [Bacteroidia bacterium]NNL61300.1 DUF2279 domain-containing protein [Flavobacteriaceae bacterium]
SDTLNKSRRNAVVITEASLASLTLIGLDQLWYNDFQRSKFRTINDNNEWLLMDKMGHVMASYYVGRVGANVLDWSGVREKDQLIYGATIGLGFLTAVEVFDGFSEEWGFSWGDMLANASGTGLYIGQELLWQEQRITMKYSFHQTKYAEIRPEKLGENFLEQTLKDYNGQTYWLSANLNSFMNEQSKIPKWLNIAFGYGADGMLTGANEEADMLLFPNQDRIKQFYLSLDVDLSRIETGSRLLRTLFDVFNFIKIPAPTIELNSKGKVFFHAVYF